jgi:predicted transposase/invertase (TIGR01784 family)
MKAFRDTIAVMEGQYLEGHAEGRTEGRAEGRAEGIEENKRDNARKMKEDGMPIELIAKYTGLSATEIESL